MTALVILVFGVAGACLLAAWLMASANNRLVALDARCKTAYADIDVQLKRRADLIPGLVECVKGMAGHEASILNEVIDARRGTLKAAPDVRQQAEGMLGRKINAVISMAEKYPDLAASAHFRELRQELVATEERITAARRFFNLAVEEYNATLGQFPANTIASRRHMSERRPFDLGIDRVLLDEAPAVRFS